MLILTPSQQTDDQQTTPISLLKHNNNNNNNNDIKVPPPPRVISAEIKKPNGCIITPVKQQQQHVQRVPATKNGCVANKNNCKKNISSSLDFIQPKISGELFVQYEDDINKKPIWLRSHVNIYGGILFITNFIINKQRIPLRDFNLRPVTCTSQDDDTSPASNRYIFALFSRHCDQRPEVTFKTRTEHEYNIWIKIISIELLKQTSIYNIKYLDLMGLTFNINNYTVSPINNNCINNNNEQEQRTRRRSSSSSSDHSTTSSHTDCSSRCSSLSSHHSSSNNSLTSRITNNYSCSRCNSLNRYNSNSSYSINDKKCSSCRNNTNNNTTKVNNTRKTPTTLSRYNSNCNNSTISKVNEKRRCFSELNLNLYEDNNTKDNFNFNNNQILASTLSTSSSSSEEEEDNLNKTKTSCIDCSNNYLSYSDYKKLLAKERIQRVLQPKIEKSQETNNNNNTVIVPIRSYTRVYNIREGVQLKSYDLQLKSPAEPIKPLTKTIGESKKLDMLRKNTNQLINNNTNSQSNVIEETVEQLLKKCQNSDNYVPVKDKLVLFESLCKLGRKSLLNNQNLIIGANNNYNNTLSIEKRRTQSMYDLNNNHINGVGGVRQICKYFETQSTTNDTNKFNTIAKGYRKVISVDAPPVTPSIESKSTLTSNNNLTSGYSTGSLKTKMNSHKTSQFVKSNTSYSLYNQSFDGFNKNTKNYFGFKQFREGNKIISYV